jgi:hypothetical protein
MQKGKENKTKEEAQVRKSGGAFIGGVTPISNTFCEILQT